MQTQLDPLLYRNDSQLQNWKRHYQNRQGSSFEELMSKKLKNHQKLSDEIPSQALSQIPARKEILAHIKDSPERLKVYEAAKEFEAFFVEKMFREMKKNVPKNPLFHGGQAEEIFDEMLLSERVKRLSENTSFGLAETIYKQLQNL